VRAAAQCDLGVGVPPEWIAAREAWASVLDLMTLYAREVVGMPDGWHWWEATSSPDEVPEGTIRLRGAVAPIGPKSGSPQWRRKDPATERTVFLDRQKFQAWVAERAERLNECPVCRGTGYRFVGVGVSTGARYDSCPRCGGTGALRAA
jgi:hypothetical protein